MLTQLIREIESQSSKLQLILSLPDQLSDEVATEFITAAIDSGDQLVEHGSEQASLHPFLAIDQLVQVHAALNTLHKAFPPRFVPLSIGDLPTNTGSIRNLSQLLVEISRLVADWIDGHHASPAFE